MARERAAAIGLELVDTAASFDAVLIALGGGALATGVGHVLKAWAPGVEVIAVQPLGAPAMTHSWRQRRVVTTGPASTIADGVAGRRPIPAVLDDLLLVADDAVLVQEAPITAGSGRLPSTGPHNCSATRVRRRPQWYAPAWSRKSSAYRPPSAMSSAWVPVSTR
jgi:threonine dehydratase